MATHLESPESESILDSTLEWLVVVLALALPLYRPWVTLATTAILILWFFGGDVGVRAARLRRHRLTLAVLAFLFLNILSLMWATDIRAGLDYLSKYRYLLLIPMIASSVKPAWRRYALTTFGLASGASVLLSAGVLVGLFRIRDAHPGNPSPTMAHLDYGLLLALAALLLLVRVLYSEMSLLRRLWWFGLVVLAVVGLMINIGRTGHLAFAGGLVVLLIHWSRGRPAGLIAGVSAGLVLALVVAWHSDPRLRSRFDDARDEIRAAVVDNRYASNLGGRVAAFKVAREVFRENPVLGTGVGSNMPAFRRIIDTRLSELKPSIYWYPHYHNQYTQVATELGSVGLLALAWMYWELVRIRGRRPELGASSLVLATVYLLGFLGEPYLHKQITLVMFSLFAGLISAEQLDDEGEVAENTVSGHESGEDRKSVGIVDVR